MDMMDNGNSFPPNVSLSPMTNTFLPPVNTTHIDNNSMMMYSQSTPTHIQHHKAVNQMPAHYFRPTQQISMYNNYASPSATANGTPVSAQLQPNQTAPNYYSMQQQQQQQSMSLAHHHSSQTNKRQALMHTQRTPQQVQLHMSMNVTLPHV
jgi:hypothetical protein